MSKFSIDQWVFTAVIGFSALFGGYAWGTAKAPITNHFSAPQASAPVPVTERDIRNVVNRNLRHMCKAQGMKVATK